MREVGCVQFVQIQKSSLKLGEKPDRYYDPAALLRVDYLSISERGAFGVIPDRIHLVDLHHLDHPDTHNDGESGVSIGFTSHYRAMRERFGEHVKDGIAGENIIIETARSFSLDELGSQVAFRNPLTGHYVLLNVVKIAVPCVEFSRFCARGPLTAEALKSTLQFLNNGMRGFILSLADVPRAAIRPGDVMAIADEVPLNY